MLKLAAALLLIFGLLHNGYWSRGGDSDVYLALARSIASGDGYTFNNQPVAIITPLWPFTLAGAMLVSPSFWFLKLMPMLLMTGGLLIWYRILSRVVSERVAFWCVLISAILAPVATLTYLFHTESMFVLISGLSVLVALQIGEGRDWRWRLPLLLVLCTASVATRWTGVLWWPVVAGALIHKQPIRIALTRVRLIAVVSSLVVTLAAFFALRSMLRVSVDQLDPRYDSTLAVQYDIGNKSTMFSDYAKHVLTAGRWIGGLLFLPAAEAGKIMRNVTSVVGWVVLLGFVAAIRRFVREHQWLILAMLAYFVWLCIDWPAPVPRYLVPIAPLFLAAGFRAATGANGWVRNAGALVAVAILLCNGICLAVEIYVARHPGYYRTYQAGTNASMIDAAKFLRACDARDAEIAVNRMDVNLQRGRFSNGWMRAMVVLTDKDIRNVPDELTGELQPDGSARMLDPLRQPIRNWLQEQRVRYYMYRPPAANAWHFRLGDTEARWRLYELRDGQLWEIDLPRTTDDWPRRVPGMESDAS